MAVLSTEMNGITFRLFTPDEIRRISVLEVVTPNLFDSLDHPLKGGLYDLAMGPSTSFSECCPTCNKNMRHCPGHFGHIELPVPVVNPMFEKEISGLIKNSCTNCHRITVPLRFKCLLTYQLKFLASGYLTESQELVNILRDQVGATINENEDMLVKERIMEFAKKRDVNFDRDTTWTKTMECLRREFLDNYNKRSEHVKTCPYCKCKVRRIVKYRGQLIVLAAKIQPGDKYKGVTINETKKVGPEVIFAGKWKQILREMWSEDSELIEEIYPILKNTGLPFPTDLMFMSTVLVTPPKTRPLNIVGSIVLENPQTQVFKEILKSCIAVKTIIKATKENSTENLSEEAKAFIQSVKGERLVEKLHISLQELQSNVDRLMSCDDKKSKISVQGLKQILEKKEGLIRKHMMGKRVNFAARSVITPDPNLMIQEIGVPEYFAKRLTYPVKVNFFNVHELRRMVKNGPDVYPGATVVEDENGSVIRLMPGEENRTKRDGIAKLLLKSIQLGGRNTVHRHLLNGDILLMNRQPTLHRLSMMAHKARILKGEKTLRMHYSNCKSYNADFDGDEMNAHLPQSEVARSEAYSIVNVKNHYLVPKDGTPLGGLIQDHVISGVRLTIRGQFFSKKDYFQLVFQGLGHHRGEIKLLPPVILKPMMLWSGKQIISTILINIIPKNKDLISLHSRAKISPRSWQTRPRKHWKCGRKFRDEYEMSESEIIIQNGELLCGVLDKQHYGATPYGLTHCLYELYGGNCSSKFLDSAGRLFTSYLQFNGFTLGIEDIIIKEEQELERKKIIEEVKKIGDIAATKALDLDEVPDDLQAKLERAYFANRQAFKARLDQEYKKMLDSFTNDINNVCLPKGLLTRFPKNNLQLMVTSGAKGSTVNTMQISCLLGQIELEGKRPPWMISGKSLPSFKAFETAPRAGGYISARFMTGITPQDFFFHCMAGREGLIDTAVKTARSGYLQRCLIKHLEGVTVCYDGTVRDHDGSVVQFAYGEDGLEVQRSTFFKMEQMDFLYRNKNSIVDKSILQLLKDSTNTEEIEKHKKMIESWKAEWGDQKWLRRSPNGFTRFSAHIRDQIPSKYYRKFNKFTGRCKATSKILEKWNELDDDMKKEYVVIRPDPVSSKYNRNCSFGVITEKLETLIEDYLSGKASQNKKVESAVRNVINVKYMSSLCQPGEAVGLLAAQSIGEPSTQMTLNTFHFAGRGEMNVTLGIPRLREILMTGSRNIKTPYMDVPLKQTSSRKIEKRGNKLKKKFQRVTLADVLEKAEVHQKLVTSPEMLITYNIRFCFLPYKSYGKEFNTRPKEILRFVEKDFLFTLCKHVRKLAKKLGDLIQESKEERKMAKEKNDDEKEDADDENKLPEPRARKNATDEALSSDEEERDDDDATAARMRDRRDEEQEYDDDDDDADADADAAAAETDEDVDDVELEIGEDENPEKVTLTAEELLQIMDRENLVRRTFPMVKSYKYDVAKEEWCEIVFGIPATLSQIDFSTILREICEKSIVYEIPNVKRAFLYRKPDGNLALKTEGINLIEAFKYGKFLDLNKLYSNDICQVACVYGIEAAARVIVNELKEVFAVYGIVIDPRHLVLIADFMTYQGFFAPCNRMTMANSPSPLQQMSFENTVVFLKDAVNKRKTDFLHSPSSRIMAGMNCLSGTGCFDLINERVTSLTKKQQTKEIRVCPAGRFE